MTVVTMRANLTDSDIRTLIKGPTEDDRARMLPTRSAAASRRLSFPQRNARTPRGILAIMAQDAAVLVRRALAVALKNSPKLPRDIAVKLSAATSRLDRAADHPQLAGAHRQRSGRDRSRLPAKQADRRWRAAKTCPSLSPARSPQYGAPEAVAARSWPTTTRCSTRTGLDHGARPLRRRFVDHRRLWFIAANCRCRRDGESSSRWSRGVVRSTWSTITSCRRRSRSISAMGARERVTVDIIEQAIRQKDHRPFRAAAQSQWAIAHAVAC
jgi:hypothetical protein